MSYDMTFYMFAINNYKAFITPFLTSALWNNKDAIAEVITDDPSFIRKKHKEFLDANFKGRWYVYGIPERFKYSTFSSKHIKSIRWMSIPKHILTYTYIGDIDILVLDKNIAEVHKNHADFIGKPYSNIVRRHPTKDKLTGLHFVVSRPYYKKANRAYLDHILQKVKEGSIPSYALDEILLCSIVKNLFGLPHPDKLMEAPDPAYNWKTLAFRPIHGIHTSINRPYTGWGVNPIAMSHFRAFIQEPIWKDATKLFGEWYVNGVLNQVENAHALWKMWVEWKRLRLSVPPHIIVNSRQEEDNLLLSHRKRNYKSMEQLLSILCKRYQQWQKK